MASDKIMNRLVIGDVGSGKTIVAVLAILNAIVNGYQALHGTYRDSCRTAYEDSIFFLILGNQNSPAYRLIACSKKKTAA